MDIQQVLSSPRLSVGLILKNKSKFVKLVMVGQGFALLPLTLLMLVLTLTGVAPVNINGEDVWGWRAALFTLLFPFAFFLMGAFFGFILVFGLYVYRTACDMLGKELD